MTERKYFLESVSAGWGALDDLRDEQCYFIVKESSMRIFHEV